MSRRRAVVTILAWGVLGGFVLVGALITAIALVGQGGIGALLPARCTVGLAGAAVSITADGPGAEASCQGWAGQVTNGGTWYEYLNGEQPAGAVICQGKRGALTITVRDEGSLNLYGTSSCKSLDLLR